MRFIPWRDKVFGRSYLPVILLFVGSLAFLAFSNDNNTRDLLAFAVKQNATALNVSLRTFRSLYTEEVVNKLKNSEFSVNHEFHNNAKAVPLPANMTIMLGERIKHAGSGSYANLYSPFPFPWRKSTGGLNDSFKREAWEFLSKYPSKEFYRIETINGEPHLRYAKADILQDSCVNCHNTHPQTPRRGWKEGDVRGILEVTQPTNLIFEKGKQVVEKQLLTIMISGVLGVLAIVLVILSFRHQLAVQKSLQINLEKRNDELEQFSYRSSHDLKAPLTSSKRLANFVSEDIESGNLSEALKNTTIIHQQMEKLENLVTDILDLAKTDVNQDNIEEIDFESMFRGAIEKLSFLAHDIEVEMVASVELLNRPLGEKARFTQITENLISNALKYCDRNKSEHYVRMKVQEDSKRLFITIEDNGVGIPIEHQDKLFEMFQRFHPTLSSGSGLGLAIVKKHVDRMLGEISCRSSSMGTEFRIELPKIARKIL